MLRRYGCDRYRRASTSRKTKSSHRGSGFGRKQRSDGLAKCRYLLLLSARGRSLAQVNGWALALGTVAQGLRLTGGVMLCRCLVIAAWSNGSIPRQRWSRFAPSVLDVPPAGRPRRPLGGVSGRNNSVKSFPKIPTSVLAAFLLAVVIGHVWLWVQ